MKQKVVLIVAIGMGLLAFVLTHLYLKAEVQRLYEGARKVAVLKARSDLPAGTVLDNQNVIAGEVFEQAVGNDVFLAEEKGLVLGRTLKFALGQGDNIQWLHIGANRYELTGLSGTIPEGMRAMSIPVSTETAVSGLVRPNDNIDILGTFSFIDEKNPGEMETVTFTVLQNVTVLATGQEIGRSELEISGSRRRSSYNTVTISVFPEEAELLAFAMNVKGTLTLTLRKPDDIDVLAQTPPIDFQTLQRDLPRLNDQRRRLQGNTRGNLIERN